MRVSVKRWYVKTERVFTFLFLLSDFFTRALYATREVRSSKFIDSRYGATRDERGFVSIFSPDLLPGVGFVFAANHLEIELYIRHTSPDIYAPLIPVYPHRSSRRQCEQTYTELLYSMHDYDCRYTRTKKQVCSAPRHGLFMEYTEPGSCPLHVFFTPLLPCCPSLFFFISFSSFSRPRLLSLPWYFLSVVSSYICFSLPFFFSPTQSDPRRKSGRKWCVLRA